MTVENPQPQPGEYSEPEHQTRAESHAPGGRPHSTRIAIIAANRLGFFALDCNFWAERIWASVGPELPLTPPAIRNQQVVGSSPTFGSIESVTYWPPAKVACIVSTLCQQFLG